MSNINKKTVKDIDIYKKTILLRTDYNVPLENNGHISDDIRISESIPTLQYLIKNKCKILICSHLGRPNGKIIPKLSLLPISTRLSELLNISVEFKNIEDIGTPEKETAQITMLENIRFNKEEEENNLKFAQHLSSFADIFVNDAFGTVHRRHASTTGITKFIPSVAGLLLSKEIDILNNLLDTPSKPFTAIIGGAKVTDKIGVLENLIKIAENILIGGGMASTFIYAKTLPLNNMQFDNTEIKQANIILKKSKEFNVKIHLPHDVIIGKEFNENTEFKNVKSTEVKKDELIMDIGPKSILEFQNILKNSKTILWNGPMGVFEWKNFSKGTHKLANYLANLNETTTIIGGGSTAEVFGKLNLENSITHISTGGGATLEFLEGKLLPGYAALLNN
ncbi:MAG: phosphoglycerate kinase [Dehalococcoidia bacterium]